jgi:hypothetical protein
MIKARVVDVEALSARTPAELATYLRAGGWRLTRRGSTSAVWTMPHEDDEFEILQPLDPGLRDYAARMRDAIEVLAVVESRSELDVLRLLSTTSMDVHTVRLHPSDQPPGTIGLDDGVLAFDSLRTLVSAAAYTVFVPEPKAVQPARKPHGLGEFLSGVRIGPSTEGSYVLSVHTPVPPRLAAAEPTLLDELGVVGPEPEPVGRQVSLRVYQAVQEAQRAAADALLTVDGLDCFTRAVDRGVSANLCEALVGLGGNGQHPFEVTLEPAAARPMSRADFSPVRFRRDHFPVLRQAAEDLRARTPESDVVVTGNVIRLYREAEATGEITIVGHVEDQDALRRIWIRLPDQWYDIAVRAHERMLPVSVRGNLVRRGTRLLLTHPTGFELLSDNSCER